jgi:nucleotide-binding universal stress UspA family protein
MEDRMTDWLSTLVFADGSSHGVARVVSAKQICLHAPGGQLDVRVPALMPVRPYGYGASIVFDEYQALIGRARSDAEKAVAPLRGALTSLGANASVSVVDVEGDAVARVAAALARTADVIVIAQPEQSSSALEGALLKGALLGSGRPCLVLPKWETPRGLGGRAIVAWKSTPEAARAVRDGLPLLKRAEKVRIFAASEDSGFEGEGAEGVAQLARYLSLHGVAVEAPVLTPPPDELTNTAGDAILAEVDGFGADLLVMGGFGHSRWSELVFGGATLRILRNARCAVLMSH